MTNTAHIKTARDTIHRSLGLAQLQFLRLTDQLLSDALSADQQELRAIKQELALTENAHLRIHYRRGQKKYQFGVYDLTTKQESGITQDNDRIHALARRTYLVYRKNALEAGCRKTKRLMDAAKDGAEEILFKKFRKYQDSGIDLTRVLFTEEQNDWMDEPYSPNPFHQEDLKHPTKYNFIMRSKSEARLGSTAEDLGLPYRYDDLVQIHADPIHDPSFRDNYFADFKFPNLTGGITVHEHFGAMHLDRYPDNSLKRLHDYQNHTIIELPGRPVKRSEITWSFEADLQNDDLIQILLKRILLPSDF